MTNTGTKFKYITIKQEGLEKFEGHPVYRVFNNKSGEQLGILSWYKPWKQYVFSSREECVFNHECLSNVIGFLKTLNEAVRLLESRRVCVQPRMPVR